MQSDNHASARLKVGFFTVLSVTVFIGFLFWVSGGQSNVLSFSEDRRFVVVPFTDITGLAPEAPVTVAGQKVGEVVNRRLEGKIAVVTMKVNKDVQLYENATFAIETTSFFGGANVNLDPGGATGDISEVRLMEPSSATIDGQQQDALVFGLTNSVSATGFGQLTEQGTVTVRQINEILADFRDDQALIQEDLARIMAATANILEEVDKSLDGERMAAIVEQVHELTRQSTDMIAENREAIREMVSQAGVTVETLNEQISARGEETGELLRTITDSVEASLTPLMMQMERLTLALERVLQDNEQSLHDTMVNLRDATANLEAFTARIRANPSLVIFGSGDADPDAASPSASSRGDGDMRGNGRMPIYDKRDDE